MPCRAATSSLRFGTTISPDYGYSSDSPGFLDFFIDGDINIGVELTRDGKALAVHEERFLDGGSYAPLRLSSWVVVDFRINCAPRISTVQANPSCLFVNFSVDFTRATIFQHGREAELILLHRRV